jgi:lipoprotein-releasing system permease protein
MLFEVKLAFRYLAASRIQTALLLSGVSVGVVVFTFIAALMNGLGIRLTNDVSGNVAHVTLEPLARVPQTFMLPTDGRALYAVQPGRSESPKLDTYLSAMAIALHTPGVRAAVPEVLGSATVIRGEKTLAVTVIGVEPHRASDIAPLGASMARGRLDLSIGNVLVGTGMMTELAVDVGDRLLLHASRGTAGGPPRDATVTVRGIFTLGVSAVDERVMYMDLGQAKSLFGFENGVSLIELKIDDVWNARQLAARLGRATHLKASNWLDRNTRLESGLRAQASSATMISVFSLLTIAIGVASALSLSVARKRSEIGILRSFGIGRGKLVRSFVLQGLTIGVLGSSMGALLGYAFAWILLRYSLNARGAPSLPIDPAQGEYLRAILLASITSAVAAVLPAWSASRIDPLEAIQS